jgi:hypothetical protein
LRGRVGERGGVIGGPDGLTRLIIGTTRVDPHPRPLRASFARLDPARGRGEERARRVESIENDRALTRLASTTPHSSRALENAKDETRLVFSSRISVRVIGGSARWLQFSRSQSRQLTPIGVPSVFSRSMPDA